MSRCVRADSCTFFNNKMKEMHESAALFKLTYCEGDRSSCARLYLFTYLEYLNFSIDGKTEEIIFELLDTLYPDQLDKVRRLLPKPESE